MKSHTVESPHLQRAGQARPLAAAATAAMLALVAAQGVLAKPLDVGAQIPDASVLDENGNAVNLRQLVSERPAVLVFYRGGWCPYCTRHLAALPAIETDLKAAGFQIVAISADQPSKIAETPDRDQLGYRLLSDATMEAAKAFGITFQVPDDLVAKYKSEYQIDLEAASGQTHHLLPHPSVFLVGTDGIVRFAYVNEDYKVRLEPEKILEAVRAHGG